MSSSDTHRRRLELFVRSLGAGGQPSRSAILLERLDELVAADVVADYSVHVAGQSIRPEVARATDPGRFLCERVASFHEWAVRAGVSLEPFVETRQIHSEITGEEYEIIVFPTAILAELEGERVRAVAPCADGEEVFGVEDLLEALVPAEGRPYPRERESRATASSGREGPVDPDPDLAAEPHEPSQG